MYGKKLKISDFNLTFGKEEKFIFAFACIKDKKYNNQYIIYTDDLNSNKLYYGSAFFRNNVLVIMETKNDFSETIKEFTSKYLNNQEINNFVFVSIEVIEKVELISFNYIEVRSESLLKLSDMSIPKPEIKIEEKEKKKNAKGTILICISILLIALAFICYLNRDTILHYGPIIHCENNYNHTKLSASVQEQKDFKYNIFGNIYEIATKSKYNFYDENEFNDFYSNGKFYEYMNTDQGDYSFDDNNYTFKMNEDITDFVGYNKPTKKEEIKGYYEEFGYVCTESR